MSNQFPKYESPLFFHMFRDEKAKGATNGITICAVPLEVGTSKFALGYSITHPEDNYIKKKGRLISESRARSFKSLSVVADNFKNLQKEAQSYAEKLLDVKFRLKEC
jgi:hypothetical protein